MNDEDKEGLLLDLESFVANVRNGMVCTLTIALDHQMMLQLIHEEDGTMSVRVAMRVEAEAMS